MLARKDARQILKQEKGVFLIESHVPPSRVSLSGVAYTVTAYWNPIRFYTGSDLTMAEAAFADAIARAPQRVR